MGGCSILGCQSRTEAKIEGITFHQFPNDEETLQKWIEATGRRNWIPKPSSRICSIHFDNDLITHKDKHIKTILKKSAVPIFDLNSDHSTRPATVTTIKSLKRMRLDYDKKIPATQLYLSESFTRPASAVETVQPLKIMSLDCDENRPPSRHRTKIYVHHTNLCCGRESNLQPHSSEGRQTETSTSLATASASEMTPEQVALLIKTETSTSLATASASGMTPEHAALLIKLKKQKEISANRLKRLRAVRESRRRLEKKVAAQQNIIDELERKLSMNSKQA